MAKTLVFEGCPACERKGGSSAYGQMFSIAGQKDLLMHMIQGGAIGAGAATVIDFVMPKVPFLSTLPATIKPLINGGITLLGAMYAYKRNPNLGIGIGIGGISIVAYKFIATMLGKVAMAPAVAAATAGWGDPARRNIEVYNDGTGVIVPVEMRGWGYGEDEVLID